MLKTLFGLTFGAKVKAVLAGAALALGASVVIGAYFKGQADCVAHAQLATARATIEQLTKERDLALELADLASQQTSEFTEKEQHNDAVGPRVDDPATTPCGLDPEWLSKLSKLR